METLEFQSSNVKRASYDEEEKELTVEFGSGKYKYTDVPLLFWQKIDTLSKLEPKGNDWVGIERPSIGAFLARNLKKFKYTKC